MLRSKAADAAQRAFGEPDLDAVRNQIRDEYAPHRNRLSDYRLQVFLDRAVNNELSTARWFDGIAGHLVGKRPDNWSDDTLGKFEFEIHNVADSLGEWLTLVKTKQARRADLTSVHVVSIDGREQRVIVHRDRPNPHLEKRLRAVREVLDTSHKLCRSLGNCSQNMLMERIA